MHWIVGLFWSWEDGGGSWSLGPGLDAYGTGEKAPVVGSLSLKNPTTFPITDELVGVSTSELLVILATIGMTCILANSHIQVH